MLAPSLSFRVTGSSQGLGCLAPQNVPISQVLPTNVALVDDDPVFSSYLASRLQELGVTARHFADSESLLVSVGAIDHDFYVLDIGLPGVDGLSLLNVLRRRSHAGVLVVSGMLGPDLFERALQAGADMFLVKPVTVDQVILAIQAVQRRSAQAAAPAATPVPVTGGANAADDALTSLPMAAQARPSTWLLLDATGMLQTPDGHRIDLSPGDQAVLRLMADAREHAVPREELARALNLPDNDENNLLNAAMYRLRRRIERGAPGVAPLQSRNRFGYQFKAPLRRA